MAKQQFEIHPAATLFPMMTEEEFQGLKADIAEHGQRERIVVWCGKILDGRNRLRAVQELQLEPDVCELDSDQDPWSYVISHNLHRRHLTTSQRGMIAGKLATLKPGHVKTQRNGMQNCIPSIEEAASQLNVSPRTAATAKQVIEHGSKEVVEAVERGELPVSLAAKFVTEEPSKKEQTRLVKQGKDAVKAHITCEDDKPNKRTKTERGHNVKPALTEDGMLQEFKSLWARCNEMAKTAIRLWVAEQS